MDNKHRKLFVGKQSKGRTFMPKMHQHTFGVLGRREGREREGGGESPPKVRVSRVNTGEEGKLCNEPMSHREEWRSMFFGSCDSFGLI